MTPAGSENIPRQNGMLAERPRPYKPHPTITRGTSAYGRTMSFRPVEIDSAVG